MKLSHLIGLLAVPYTVFSASDKPNIVFIFTDDQDYLLNSLDYMPNVQKHLVQEGTLHQNHYATISVCCPSRVSLLRGQYSHNTNVTHVLPPYGGYDRYNSLHLGDDNFPVWLQQAGYYTNYIGKLMNGYTVNNYNNPAPKGFHHQDQLLDPFTYVYDTAVFSTNGEAPVYYPDAYQTDIIHAKTKAALKRIEQTEEPFFLWVAPMAPHGEFKLYDNGTMKTGPAVPAARHAHYFNNTKIPRTPHFNPSIQGKTASYWKRMDQLDDHLVEELDEAYRNRLRALQAVDDIVGTVFEELERQGKLENTYVVYSADNGYHIGQHRSYPGKCTNLEEDINVPLIVRGPGIPKKHISTVVSAHHDLGPTFLALAKGYNHVPNWVDGGVIPLTSDLANHPKPVSKESFAVEFWSDINLPEYYDNVPADGPNTYKTLRIISTEYNYMYAVWCTGEHEFYNLKEDPYQLSNNYHGIDPQLLNRLDSLLMVLKVCRADSCRNPWKVLHPGNPSVRTLADALDPQYDAHYAQFGKVKFEECLPYYLESNESPGDHFRANYTRTSDQVVFSLKGQKYQRPGIQLPKAYHQLYNLIPKSTSHVGQQLPGDEFESHALPVPSELVSTNVQWMDYGFYTYGN